MASNFDFLKDIDEELFLAAKDGERLFKDKYFNQSVIQFRICAEKMAKNILNQPNSEYTLDTVLNNLKDKIKNQREKEFVEDLFFIKQEGNKCAHGEDTAPISAFEVIKRAFEAAINYVYIISGGMDKNIDKSVFNEALLITSKPKNEKDKTELTNDCSKSFNTTEESGKEELLKNKQEELLSLFDKSNTENGIKDKNSTKTAKNKQKKSKKELTLFQQKTKQKIKNKIKETRKNLKENINKSTKETKIKKQSKKPKRKTQQNFFKKILFILFVLFSVFMLFKMMI